MGDILVIYGIMVVYGGAMGRFWLLGGLFSKPSGRA